MKKLIIISVFLTIVFNCFSQLDSSYYEINELEVQITHRDSIRVYSYLPKFSNTADIDTLNLSANDFKKIAKSVKTIKICTGVASITTGIAFLVFNFASGKSDYYAYSGFAMSGIISVIIIRSNQNKIKKIINKY